MRENNSCSGSVTDILPCSTFFMCEWCLYALEFFGVVVFGIFPLLRDARACASFSGGKDPKTLFNVGLAFAQEREWGLY